jgi:putative ATP-dependent endonuclease of the OLD family
MTIERIIVRNYRALRNADVTLGSGTNIIVGNNEAGKSTLLEAINLALKCQLGRRPIAYELHAFLFNTLTVAEFIASHRAKKPNPPPEILIELYLKDDKALADLKGSINSLMLDQPGISLTIRLDENFKEEYREYISDPDALNGIPVEYYEIVWQSFAGQPLQTRAIPIKSVLIDPSSISNTNAANRYILEIVRDYLDKSQAVDLALSYRKMRDEFVSDARIAAINTDLASKTGIVSDKALSVAMDVTSKAGWESSVLPHLDGIPLTLIGKGEQNAVKVKLAMEASDKCHVFLMEEPENHLSHSNLNRLINKIIEKSDGRQLIITTHSSFVLNKLGIDNTLMFNGQNSVRLNDLPKATEAYFRKLPGYDTLRMILSEKTLLVEGPSDELLVQKAFQQTHGKMPLEAGVEVISVNSLAFKRFLDIAKLLKLDVCVIGDNDGKSATKEAGYAAYSSEKTISIHIGKDDDYPTLEPQLVKANGLAKLNRILGKTYADEAGLIHYMTNHKADTALMLFDSTEAIDIPEYIKNAIA